MKGIQYLVDDNGEKTAVQIDLKEYRELWEDFYDCIIFKLRSDEPRESFEVVKERLMEQGKLNG